MDTMIDELHEVNYWWLLLSVFLAFLSHVSRAMRWMMLVKPLGFKPSFLNSFFSVMSTYLANYALPRLGEVTRPTIIKRYEGIPFTQTFGTIVLERIIDLIMLFILTVVVAVTQYSTVSTFVQENPETQEKVVLILKILLYLTIAGTVFLIIFLGFFRSKLRKFKLYQKISELGKKFMEGIQTIRKLDNLPLFIIHTLFIWFMYYMMMWVSFFAFGFTEHLDLMAGLTVFVLGSYGMVAPVQGGLGAWHVMVSKTLVIVGVMGATKEIQDQNAELFALVHHGAQTLMILVVGSLSVLLLPVVNRKKP